MTDEIARSGASVSPAARCSKSSTGSTSSRCRRSPIALPNGAFAGSVSRVCLPTRSGEQQCKLQLTDAKR